MKTCAMIGMLTLLAGQAAGQCELAKTRPDDANAGDRAGCSVAIQGDIMLIGSDRDDQAGLDAGAVHVMVRPYGYWKELTKLMTKHAEPGDAFGASVAFDGTFAMVGAPSASPGGRPQAGSVTGFFRWGDAWIESTRMLIPGYDAADLSGCAVAMNGPWGVFGSRGDDTANGPDSGSISFVSIGQDGTFTIADTVAAPGGDADDQFGDSVAIDGPWAAGGAVAASFGGASECGTVSLFQLANGSWQPWWQVIAAPDRSYHDAFGASVALGGNLLAVGAPSRDQNGTVDAGAVYVYRFDGTVWVFETAFFGRGVMHDHFGYRVAITGGRVYASNSDQGMVFAYEKVGGVWKQVDEMVDPDGPGASGFGSGLATDGKTLAIGDDLDDYNILNEADNGAVYTKAIKPACVADFNGDGAKDIFDFLAFQNAFVAHEPAADTDCNGAFDLFDFLGFQNQFLAGCP